MNNYMEILPLKCPKCKSIIKYMTNLIRNKKQYSQCPKCKYFTKDNGKFVDKKEVEKRHNIKYTTFISD